MCIGDVLQQVGYVFANYDFSIKRPDYQSGPRYRHI